MLSTAYNFNLGNPIRPGLACIAKLDGKVPTLVCVTVGGKVLIYTPKGLQGDTAEVKASFLNINKNIKSIATGSFASNEGRDVLIMASDNTLIAFDVEKNSDIF